MSTSTINPVSITTPNDPTAASTSTSTSTRSPVRSLGQDDFLKLLVAQMGSQDPMNPQKDTDFIAQMAQFSSLEQTRAMQADLAGLRADQQVQRATELVGRDVVLHGGDGEIVSGRVSGLNLAGDTPRIVVNGAPFTLASLISVSAPARQF